MKLSRTAFLVLGIGIFIIAFVTLYVVYSGQSGEQRQLNDSLVTANARLPKLVSDRTDLESQLAQRQNELSGAETALSHAKANLSLPVESIDYDETLVSFARDCDLEVAKLTASEPSDLKVKGEAGEITYTITTLEVTVRSAESKPSSISLFDAYISNTIADALTFIDTIAKSEGFNNATIELVRMENLKPPATEDDLTSAPKPSATIRLVIYNYKGE